MQTAAGARDEAPTGRGEGQKYDDRIAAKTAAERKGTPSRLLYYYRRYDLLFRLQTPCHLDEHSVIVAEYLSVFGPLACR